MFVYIYNGIYTKLLLKMLYSYEMNSFLFCWFRFQHLIQLTLPVGFFSVTDIVMFSNFQHTPNMKKFLFVCTEIFFPRLFCFCSRSYHKWDLIIDTVWLNVIELCKKNENNFSSSVHVTYIRARLRQQWKIKFWANGKSGKCGGVNKEREVITKLQSTESQSSDVRTKQVYVYV